MTEGKTVLLQKDKQKGTAVDNYRPITCLPTMWKLLSGMLSDEIRSHLQMQKGAERMHAELQRNQGSVTYI